MQKRQYKLILTAWMNPSVEVNQFVLDISNIRLLPMFVQVRKRKIQFILYFFLKKKKDIISLSNIQDINDNEYFSHAESYVGISLKQTNKTTTTNYNSFLKCAEP